LALGETVWSRPESKSWLDFQYRLSQHYRLLQKKNVNYCRPSDRVDMKPEIDPVRMASTVTFSTEQYEPEIRYTLNGTMPTANDLTYGGPITVRGSSIVKAAIFRNGKASRPADSLYLSLHKALGKPITYNKKWSGSYPAQLEKTLVNGYRGSLTYQDGQWQGFLNDVDVTIDLGSAMSLSSIQSNFMQVTGPGVYMPHYLEVSVSTDGVNFSPAQRDNNTVSPNESRLVFKNFTIDLKGVSARYVRVIAKHQKGFMFADEIIVE
jgi:hexosaminidase